jgi:hypothetical protein
MGVTLQEQQVGPGWAWATRRAGMADNPHDGANYEKKSVDELRTLNNQKSSLQTLDRGGPAMSSTRRGT